MNKTLILVVLDESGSMGSKQNDVIGGYNRFLEDQKVGPDEGRLSLIKFNTEHTVVHDAVPIANAIPLSVANYVPGGSTALLDAVAESVRVADKAKQPDERVICLVITDGEENSSRETTVDQARAIIKEREDRGDWTFTYLGISPDKWRDTGVVSSAGNAAAYNAANPAASFAAMGQSVNTMRASASARSSNFYQKQPPPAAPPAPSSDDDAWKQPRQSKR